MSPKNVFVICAQIFLIQQAYSQVLGYGNLYGGPSYALGLGEVDVTAVEVDSIGLGAAYGGYGLGNVGALGAAGIGGIGASGLGLGGIGATGLGVAGAGLGLGGLGSTVVAGSPAFLNLNGLAAGGVLPITSIGPIVPAGLTVVSDNVIEGAVAINGQLPFLSAVAFEGALPSAGSGISQCGCGAGSVGILSETVGPAAGVAGVSGLGLGGLGLGGIGLGGLAGRGLIL